MTPSARRNRTVTLLRALLVRLLAALAVAAAIGLPLGPSESSATAAHRPWRWPVDPPVQVVRGFEAPAHAYARGHRGVDLAAREGTHVRAAGAGTVVLAGSVAGRAVVVVAHGEVRSATELRTTYQPVAPTVRVGQRVAIGAELGRLGTWPGHCPGTGAGAGVRGDPGSCLHWGLRRGHTYLDPLSLLRGPVRLLPVGPPVPTAAERPAAAPEVGAAARQPERPALTAPRPTASTGAEQPTPTIAARGTGPVSAELVTSGLVTALGAGLGALTVGGLAQRRRTRAPRAVAGPRRSVP